MNGAAYHDVLDRVERDHWWFHSLRELVVATLDERVPPGSRVLEVGCSTGHLLAALAPSYERTGIDVEPGAIELARRRSGIRFLEASVEALPFDRDCFDAVLATDSISASGVEDDRRALSEVRRVLRPRGTLVLQVAAYEWLRSGHDAVAGTGRRYTAAALRGLLAATGFEVEHMTYRITALFPIAVARRLLRRRRMENDVAEVHPALNRALGAVMQLENRATRRLRLPFGLSVFAVATPASDPS